MTSRFSMLVISLIMVVITLTATIYWQGLDGPFVLDDPANISSAYVEDFNLNEIIYSVTHNESGMLGRPISMISLVYSGLVYGPEPWGYKFDNLIIHILNGLLIFWLLVKLLPRLSPQLTKENIFLISGLTASCWLLHPLMVSTVLYVVQRMAQLSTLFILFSLLAYVYAREGLIENKIRKFFSFAYLLFPIALLMALFSKENGALIPFYILTIELIIYRFSFNSAFEKKQVLVFTGIFVALPIVIGSLYALTHYSELVDYTIRDFNLIERLMTQLHAIIFYVKLILLPRLADMSLFHDDFEAIRQLDIVTTALFVLFIAAVSCIFLLRKKTPVIAFAIAWFVVSHLLESTFISLELIFEHRNYLASVGPIFALIYYLCQISAYPRLKYVCFVLLLFWTFLTATRVGEWTSELVFYQIAVQEHPQSLRANSGFARTSYEAGDVDTAFEYIRRAQALDEKESGAFIHELLLLCGSTLQAPNLIRTATERVRLYPISTYAFNALNTILGGKKVSSCPEVALDDILIYLNAAKDQIGIQENIQVQGYLERSIGLAYMYKGNYSEGELHLNRAFEYTQQTSVLIELLDIQIRIGQFEGVDRVMARLEKINEENYGIETARISQLREIVANAKANNSE